MNIIIPNYKKIANNAKQIFVQRNEEEKKFHFHHITKSLAGFAPVINPEFITENIAGLTEIILLCKKNLQKIVQPLWNT